MSAGKTLCTTASLLFLYVPLAARAEIMPPPNVPRYSNIQPTRSDVPISRVQMGSLSIVFEHTTLPQIVREVGNGVIQHQGDAGESLYWVCYTISLPEQSQRIWITSGELGGSEHVVDGAAQIFLRKTANASCPELAPRFRQISFGKGLTLGSSEKDFIYWFGRPSGRKANWLFYESEKDIKGWSTDGFVAAKIDKGKASIIVATSTTTN